MRPCVTVGTLVRALCKHDPQVGERCQAREDARRHARDGVALHVAARELSVARIQQACSHIVDVVTGMPVQLMAVRPRFENITQSVPHVLPALPLQTAA